METYNSIIWDFDGVILNSNEIRNRGFIEVLKEYPDNEVSKLMTYHEQNGGLSRYHKLRYFFEVIRNEEVSDEEILHYANAFKVIMLSHLCNPDLLIQDSLDYIIKYHESFQFHIASGSDNNELNEICKTLGIDKYFKSINGSPTPKIQVVKDIIESQSLNSTEYALIGDSINDFEAAEANSINFYAYNNNSLRANHNYIETFLPLKISPSLSHD